MSRVAKLIMVTANNNNKFYNMEEVDGELKVEYGRVNHTKSKKIYPLHKWDYIYRSKIKKGYKDITSYRVEEESTDFIPIPDSTINSFVVELQTLANRTINNNYSVSSKAVTQAQVDEAQRILNSVLKEDKADSINKLLIDLYTVIPRKMSKVNDYLISDTDSSDYIKSLITDEQATLDVMAGQVKVNIAQQSTEDKTTILEAMGLEIRPTLAKEVKVIKKELGNIKDRYLRSFSVINKKTQEKFDKFIAGKEDNRKLFWHGSRNENWWSILDSGLILRPTNAVITGRMFGYGLYFTDKAKKSYGYTSCRGSYWANGSDCRGFMSLYDVFLGRTLTKQRHESWMYDLTDEKLKQRGDYDSLSALGGADLYNNEFIIYNEAQSTIKYIVEVG